MNGNNPTKPKDNVKCPSVVTTNASHLSHSQTKSLLTTSIASSCERKCKSKATESKNSFETTSIEYEKEDNSSTMQPTLQCYNTSNIIIVDEATRAGKDKNNSAAETETVQNDRENVSDDYDILSLAASVEKDDESFNTTESSRTELKEDETVVETGAVKNKTKYDGKNYNISRMYNFTRARCESDNINNAPESSRVQIKTNKNASASSKSKSRKKGRTIESSAASTDMNKSPSKPFKAKPRPHKSSKMSSKPRSTTNNPSESSWTKTETNENTSEVSKAKNETKDIPNQFLKSEIGTEESANASSKIDPIKDKTPSDLQNDKSTKNTVTKEEITLLRTQSHEQVEGGKNKLWKFLTKSSKSHPLKTTSDDTHEEQHSMKETRNSQSSAKLIQDTGILSNDESLTPKEIENVVSKQSDEKIKDQIQTTKLKANNMQSVMQRVNSSVCQSENFISDASPSFIYPPKETASADNNEASFMNLPMADDDEGLPMYLGEMKLESRLEEQMCSVMKEFHSNFFEFYVKNQYSFVPCYIGITILKLVNIIIIHGIDILLMKKSSIVKTSLITLGGVCVVEVGIFIAVILTDSFIKRKAIQSTVFRYSCPIALFSFDLFTVILCLHYYKEIQDEDLNGADNGWCVPTVFLNIVLLPCSVTTSSLLSVIVFAAHVVHNSINETQLDFFDRFSKVSIVTWNYLCSFVLGFAVKHLCQHTISRGYDECKRIYRRQEEILVDTQRQEYLLKTILPPMVATEILRTVNVGSPSKELTLFKKPFMSKYEDVSILFADVVGFTIISSNLKAKDLVCLLDVLFQRFDALSTKYDVLRIEIAGDCYIAVCGTEKFKKNHASLMVRTAMGMVDVMGTVNEVLFSNGYKWNLDLRIGINSGDIVGGVVGRYRWRFDVVGRNVLLANQMESTGVPGKIHITEFTRLLLPSSFTCVAGPDHPFDYDADTQIVKTFFVESITESVQELHERRRRRSKSKKSSNFNQRQISLDNTLADIVHLGVHNKIAMNKLTLTFESTEIEKTFQKFRIQSSIHDLYLTTMVLGLRYCGSMMQIQIVDSSAFTNCLIFVILLLFSSLCFLPHESPLIRCHYIRIVRRELYKNFAFRIFVIILIIFSTLSTVFLNNESKFCKDLEENLTETSSREDSFNFATFCRTSNDQHLVTIMHLISLQSVGEWTIIGSVLVMVLTYSILLLLIRHERYIDSEIVNGNVIESWIFTFILFVVYYVIKLEFRKTFAWRWNVQCSLFRAQWARQTNQALMSNIFPVHVAAFFYYQEAGKVQYSQQHELVAVMFASIMNAKDNLRLKSADHTLEWLRLLHSIIMEIDQFLDWPFLEPVTKMKTMGSMYMAASGLKVTNPKQISEALVAMCEFGLAIIDLIEDLNRKPDNMLQTRIGVNIGPVFAGVVCHHRPHYDIWGNTVNVASRMESQGVIGCMQITAPTMITLQRISNYQLVRRGKIQVKGKGEMVTYFVKRQEVEERKSQRTSIVADVYL